MTEYIRVDRSLEFLIKTGIAHKNDIIRLEPIALSEQDDIEEFMKYKLYTSIQEYQE